MIMAEAQAAKFVNPGEPDNAMSYIPVRPIVKRERARARRTLPHATCRMRSAPQQVCHAP